MKISKELQMLAEMKDSHDRISNYDYKVTDPIEDRMKMHRRKMDNVQRLSGFKLIQDYSLTKHCFHTGLLFMEYAEKEDIYIRQKYIEFVFKHDILETVTGDMLYPAKNYNKVTRGCSKVLEQELTNEGEEFEYLKEYTDDHAECFMPKNILQLFKAVDLLELLEFCKEEYQLGNETIVPVITNCTNILENCGIPSIEKEAKKEWN